jgi:bacteriocin biosynthesis cyclodehydratase domain-containing protein
MRTLKRGTSLFTTSTPGEYFLGTSSRAIRIYTSEQKIIAEHLARGVDEHDIARIAGVSPIAIHNLMTELAHQSLIDLTQGSITLADRFISKLDGRAQKNSKPQHDGAYIQLQNRISPELEQSTWIDGVTDGGISVLSGRQSYLIEISGSSRVATLLYMLLLASGFTQVRFTQAARGRDAAIGDLDIAVDGMTSAHFGFSFTKKREELRREYSLFPLDKSANYLDEASTPDLVIACGDIDPEKLALWMSYGQTFITIPHPTGGRAEIGPIVIPGKTPCLRCAQLSEREQSGVTDQRTLREESSHEYPQIAAHAIAAMAASKVVALCDERTVKDSESTNFSQLSPEHFGKITVVDYQSLTEPQVVAITRHPLCGCAF